MAENILKRLLMIKPSESNAEQQLPLTLLVAQMIDIATDHANELGIGFINLEPKGLGWVLSRLSVEMKRWPATGENYILSTWIESYNSHFSDRCFSISGEDGEILGYARTVWMIIDLKTHKSVGTAGTVMPSEMIPDFDCPIPKWKKHHPFTPHNSEVYIFKYNDLDYYRHVNTIRYISLLLNQFTLDDFDCNLLSRFDIAFAHEARYGEHAVIDSIDEEVDNPSSIKDGPKSSRRRIFEISVESRPILSASITLTEKSQC